MHQLDQRYRSRIRAPRSFAWDCYTRDGMFERLTPPWQRVRTARQHGGVAPGDWRLLAVQFGPLTVHWEAMHREWQPGHFFSDEQTRGPFTHWRHKHRFRDSGSEGSILEDRLEFALPLAPVTPWLGETLARRELRRMFAFRHLMSRLDIERHFRHRSHPRIHATVSSTPAGFRSQLCAFLTSGGHDVASGAAPPQTHSTENARPVAATVIEGTDVARIEWPSGRSHVATADLAHRAELIQAARSEGRVFGDRSQLAPWAAREALFSAIYDALMGGAGSES